MTSILKADTIQDTDGNNIINESGNTITIGASGDTTNIIGTLQNDGVAVTMAPAFHAFLSADQGSLSDAATVKVQVNSETYDSDGTYDNSTNYRFTPGVAGKYFIYGAALISAGATANMREGEVYIYKNGSSIGKSTFNYVDQYSQVATPMLNIVDVANTTDYYELYAQVNTQNSGNWTAIGDSTQQRTYFGAYRITGV
tara:strand:- start:770 stop:1366 length:597 start_codon:yes stop_codon:yes gene_type:complete